MTNRELSERYAAAEKVQKEVRALLPYQEERHQGIGGGRSPYRLWWRADWMGDRFEYHLSADDTGSRCVLLLEADAALVRRYTELREALDRWQANEGPWPLALALAAPKEGAP